MKHVFCAVILFFVFQQSFSQIVINELDCDTPGVDDKEFLELKSDTPKHENKTSYPEISRQAEKKELKALPGVDLKMNGKKTVTNFNRVVNECNHGLLKQRGYAILQ